MLGHVFVWDNAWVVCVSKKHKLAWWFRFDLALGRSWDRTWVSQNLTLFVKRWIVGWIGKGGKDQPKKR